MEQGTRLTNRCTKHRTYSCDRCGEKKIYEGRIEGWYDFNELRVAWENGEIDISWWCRRCLSKQWGVRPGVIGREDWERRLRKRRGSTTRLAPPQKRQRHHRPR